jgi:predicted SnoaL-like aldol condensation-catalyzing enzyme
MAERKKPERSMMMPTQEIITIKRELDKAVQERMKLSQIYCSHNSSVAVSAAIVYYFSALSSEYESAAAAIARVSTNAAIISVSITFHLSTPNIVTTTCL